MLTNITLIWMAASLVSIGFGTGVSFQDGRLRVGGFLYLILLGFVSLIACVLWYNRYAARLRANYKVKED